MILKLKELAAKKHACAKARIDESLVLWKQAITVIHTVEKECDWPGNPYLPTGPQISVIEYLKWDFKVQMDIEAALANDFDAKRLDGADYLVLLELGARLKPWRDDILNATKDFLVKEEVRFEEIWQQAVVNVTHDKISIDNDSPSRRLARNTAGVLGVVCGIIVSWSGYYIATKVPSMDGVGWCCGVLAAPFVLAAIASSAVAFYQNLRAGNAKSVLEEKLRDLHASIDGSRKHLKVALQLIEAERNCAPSEKRHDKTQ